MGVPGLSVEPFEHNHFRVLAVLGRVVAFIKRRLLLLDGEEGLKASFEHLDCLRRFLVKVLVPMVVA